MPRQNLQPPQIDPVESSRPRRALLKPPHCAGVGSLAAAPTLPTDFTLAGFLSRGGRAVLEAARLAGAKNVSQREADLKGLDEFYDDVEDPELRSKIKHFAAMLVVRGVPLKKLALPKVNLLDPEARVALLMHYCPLLKCGPDIPDEHECIAYHLKDLFENANKIPEEFRKYIVVIDIIYVECPTTLPNGRQRSPSQIREYSAKVHRDAGLDPQEMFLLYLDLVRTIFRVHQIPRDAAFASGGAAFDWGKTHLPELTLPEDELLAHSQSARNMLLGAKNIVEETGPEVKSWPIPGDDLLNSSTKGATRFVSLVSADPVSESRAPYHNGPPAQAIVTIYWDSYNQDPELIEKCQVLHEELDK